MLAQTAGNQVGTRTNLLLCCLLGSLAAVLCGKLLRRSLQGMCPQQRTCCLCRGDARCAAAVLSAATTQLTSLSVCCPNAGPMEMALVVVLRELTGLRCLTLHHVDCDGLAGEDFRRMTVRVLIVVREYCADCSLFDLRSI